MANNLKDKLGLSRNKVKVTLYTKNGKELDLRCPIHGNKIEIRKFGKEGAIDINPDIESNPLYDKGQRYVVFEGIDHTIYPPEIVEKGIGNLTREQKISNSDSWNRGVRYAYQLIEHKEKDMLKYILYAVLGVAAIIIIVNLFVLQHFDTLKAATDSISLNLDTIKEVVTSVPTP